MKNSKARQHIILEAGPKFVPALISLQVIHNVLKSLWSSPPLHVLGILGVMLVVFGGLMLLSLLITDNTTASKSPSNEEKRSNARKARQELGICRTTWIFLSVIGPAALAQSLVVGGIALWLDESHPPVWVYAALGLVIGLYASFLMGLYYATNDLLAAPQTTDSLEK